MSETGGASGGGDKHSGRKPTSTPNPGAAPEKARQDPLISSLRAAYDSTLAEPVPPALADLLRRLE